MNAKFFTNSILFLSVILLTFSSCKNDNIIQNTTEECIVVTNRGSSNMNFINAFTNAVTDTLNLTGSELMYPVYVPTKDRIYVGDRANNKVYVINPQSKSVEDSITVGNGVFHMWADDFGKQLWVVNDIDSSISVIDLLNNTVIQTIHLSIIPHDVFVTNDGTKAYISSLNTDPNLPDQVLMYSTSSFTKTGEITLGKEPHLYYLSNSNKLFAPCESGRLYTLNGNDLSIIANDSLFGAHGIYPFPDQQTIFISDILSGHIYSINTSNSSQNGTPTNSINPAPHNIAIVSSGDKMFVTHRGSNLISTYWISSGSLSPGTSIAVGSNPFGIAYYKRVIR